MSSEALEVRFVYLPVRRKQLMFATGLSARSSVTVESKAGAERFRYPSLINKGDEAKTRSRQ